MLKRGIQAGMVSRLMSGQSIKQAMAWAKEELSGFRCADCGTDQPDPDEAG